MTALTQARAAAAQPVLDLNAAQALLIEEAHHLDQRQWDEWLALYTEDAEFWAPAWQDCETPTSDPQTELSLIYYSGRVRLEERVWRVRSGQSAASAPMPRTLHMIGNVRLVDDAAAVVESNVVVHVFQPRRRDAHANFATCRHSLRHGPDGWRIAAKKILLLNDYLPSSIDFYSI